MNFLGKKCCFHVDLDAFFASVEQKEHPEYKGKPVIVGGLPGDRRSVVSTASYEAREYGVHSAMSLTEAVKKCPDGIYVRGDMKLYSSYSKRIMKIFSDFSPDVHQVSVDEAFLDMTGTERLFGDQVETAKLLKKKVFEETGLTCSVGIATTNYIAKICSGYRKPDGLFAVLPGDEEKFMLSLPLNKVWGIGEKTLTRLNSAGFRTTKDIHDHSLTLLSEVFGSSTGNFLYNTVRGIEPEDFLSEAKSHSLGNENTYEYDLTEWNAIESALMELSEGIMFRLLENNLTGKTVHVKIRYEDFTTVSIQGTSVHAITNSDELYERALDLFKKKYESGRGIRLLGISISNTEKQDDILERELFDFGEKKKQLVEKSILGLKKKNPDLEIHKARLMINDKDSKKSALREKFNDSKNKLKTVLFFFVLAMFSLKPVEASDVKKSQNATGSGSMVMDDSIPPEKGFSGTTLFFREYNDNSIEFLAQGFWDSKIKQNIVATYGFGNPFNIDFAPPVFIQEVDMSIWFLLNDHWYFEAAFADSFNKNTIAAGYRGNSYIREVRIANRKIVFPDTYSVSDVNRGLGGSDNQAPGISFSAADPDERWSLDAVFRYDMLVSRSKTYYGKNSVSDTNYAKEGYQTGRMFTLPQESDIASIRDIYVESYSGTYRDRSGIRYKKLSGSDYLLIPSKKLIYLSKEAGASRTGGRLPAVCITMTDPQIARVKAGLGTYGTSDAPGTLFLGKIQRLFGNDDPDTAPDVAAFSYGGLSGKQSVPDKTGTSTDGFFTAINGEPAVILQHPQGFSPFAVCFRYDAGTQPVDDIAVAHRNTDGITKSYSAHVTDEEYAFVEKNFTQNKHSYVDIKSADSQTDDYSDPLVRYPFAQSYPGTYLGYGSTDDLVLRIRHYTPVNRFDIGTDAVSGTVQVYKNGVIDSGAKFNSQTGEVILSSGFSQLDKIYIVWYEDKNTQDTGAIAGALGFAYNFTENLSGDASFATRWTVNQNVNYADAERSSPGWMTLASRVSYKTDDFSISNTVAGTLENDNTTGFYRILSMNDKGPSTSYLSEKQGSSLPANFAPRLNSRPDESSSPLELEPVMNRSGSNIEGKNDSEITGYKIPVTFNFSDTGSPTSPEWAATAIKISGTSLSQSSTFSFACKNESNLSPDVYLQLGVEASDDFDYESIGTVPTWKISEPGKDVKKSFDASNHNWQTVTVILTDNDRAFCTKNHHARLIVVNKTNSREAGAVYFGPYEISEIGMDVKADKSFTITKGQVSSSHGGEISFSDRKNFAEEISWKNTEAAVPSDPKLTMYKYFPETDISPYQYVKLVFRSSFTDLSPLPVSDAECEPALSFILDTDSASVNREGKLALKAVISSKALKNYSDNMWHTLTVSVYDRKIKIDGNSIPSGETELYVNKSVVPTRLYLKYNTCQNNLWNREGSFYIDELYLSENSPHFLLEDKATVFYQKKGSVLSTENMDILKDFHVKASGDGNVTLHTNPSMENKGNGSGTFDTGFTLLGVTFNTNLSHAQDSDRTISEAGHSVRTEKSIAKLLDFYEAYNFNPEDKSAKKENSVALDFSDLGLPVKAQAETKASSDLWSVNQSSREGLSLNLSDSKTGYLMNAEVSVSQKIISTVDASRRFDSESYFESYGKATRFQFSQGESAAASRTENGKLTNKILLPWINLQPELNFYAGGTYSSSTGPLYNDTSKFEFKVPFRLGSNSISFGWTKSSGAVNNSSQTGDYFTDIGNLASSFTEREYFFTAPIFYDLFSDELADSVHAKTKNYEDNSNLSESYTGLYDLSFNRQIYASLMDFFVPSAVSFSASRDIRTAKNLSDTYQFKGTVNFTAFNIFGSSGSNPVFSWFQEDEYITSFIATYRVPRSKPEDLTQIYTLYLQNGIYFTRDNVLRNGVQFEFQDENNFQTKYSVLWNRTGKDSLFLALARLFKRDLDTSNVRVSRTDGLNCTWKKSASSTYSKPRHYQSYDYNHKVDLSLTKYAAVYAAIDLGWSSTWDEICTLIATWTLGGRLTF